MGTLKKTMAGLAIGATMVAAAATPAEARWRGGGYYGHGGGYGGGWRGGRGYYGRRGGVSTGAAVGIGVLGLGLGAALASRPRYYDRGYYGGGYPAGGYGYGAYGGGYGGYVGPECYTRRVWDPYIGRRVRVRTCY